MSENFRKLLGYSAIVLVRRNVHCIAPLTQDVMAVEFIFFEENVVLNAFFNAIPRRMKQCIVRFPATRRNASFLLTRNTRVNSRHDHIDVCDWDGASSHFPLVLADNTTNGKGAHFFKFAPSMSYEPRSLLVRTPFRGLKGVHL